MSNEINISLESGLTLISRVFSQSGTQQGSDVLMSEVSNGQYSGSFDVSGLSDSQFMVLFFVGSENRGFGSLYVRNGEEITQEKLSTLNDIIIGNNS